MEKRRYKYILKEDFNYEYNFSKLFEDYHLQYIDSAYGIIYEGEIQIDRDYAWNGCSGNVWQGKTIDKLDWMPDVTNCSDRYTQTLTASLMHDYIYQYLYEISEMSRVSKGVIRKIADQQFYHVLKESEFEFARMYYYGVRSFGATTYIKKWYKNKYS